jgi:hypothetical protein
MAFDPIRSDRGAPRMQCVCDDCERVEVVAAMHGKDGKDGEGQAAIKVQRLGWTYIGKRLRCAACEAKRKADGMIDKKQGSQGVRAPAPREPTRTQKFEIMDLLRDVYDRESGCYRRGDTDETVAEVLEVMPGWVAQLREEFFGPAGSNQDMAALRADLDAVIAKGEAIFADLQARAMGPLLAKMTELEEFRNRLTKIERAVGPRVMARAK